MKVHKVNEFLASVPPDALVVYPDSDELFDFPCNLSALIRDDALLRGRMVDRVASDWSLPPVRVGRPIDKQFERRCDVVGGLEHSGTFKILMIPTTLHGKSVRLRSSHSAACVPYGKSVLSLGQANEDAFPRCDMNDHGPPFSHYRFTHDTIGLTRRKLAMYDKLYRALANWTVTEAPELCKPKFAAQICKPRGLALTADPELTSRVLEGSCGGMTSQTARKKCMYLETTRANLARVRYMEEEKLFELYKGTWRFTSQAQGMITPFCF